MSTSTTSRVRVQPPEYEYSTTEYEYKTHEYKYEYEYVTHEYKYENTLFLDATLPRTITRPLSLES